MTDIQIYSSSATPLILAPITSSSRYEQELMKTDRIHLEWDAVDNLPIPLGSYVLYQGTRYILTKPYHPESKDMGRYTYKVDFDHELMTLAKIPFLLYTPQEDGTTQVECDWNYTGDVDTLATELKKSLNSALNASYNIIVDESIKTAVSLSFSNKDILSALNEICSNIECEWWYEGSTIKIAPKCINEGGGSSVLSLVAGEHVDYPSSNDKAEFFNRFYVFGGTRNIPQDYQGAQASTIINKRLTLDKTIHQSGYLDLPYFDINGDITISNTPREGFAPFYTEEGEVKYYKLDPSVVSGGSIFTKVLQLDDIYPRAELKVAHIARREKYVRDDADKPVETASGYSTFFVYYVQFTTKDGSIFHFNPKTYTKGQGGDVIKNQKPSIHFNSGSLTGREFEIYNHYTQIPQIKNETGDKSNVDFSGFVEVQGEASIFEIAFKEDGTIIIPNIGIAPQVDDEAVVFGIRMPEQYVHNAYIDLDQKAIEQIYELSKDGNEYSVKSNQVYFAESNPNLTLGRHVHLNLGDRVIDTRVIKLTTKLDRPYEQEIAFCKAISKGSIQTILTTIENTQQQVIETQLIDDENVRRARQRMSEANEELRNSIFDTDGYFKDGNIKPETIETLMLSVGAKSTDYMLEGVVFAPNNDGTTTANPNAVNIIQGTTAKLTHFGISEGEAKEWTLAKPASAYTTDEEGKAFADAQVYYLYARCASNGTSGTFVFSKEKYKYNQFVDTNKVYYFLVGILSSVIDGSRILNMTYGSTTINGEQIRTGILRANNDKVRINLNTGEIFSQDGIKFIPTGKTDETSIEGYLSTALGIYDYLANAMKLASAYGSTTIDGGLVLTSAMVLSNPLTKEVMAGINGVISQAKDIVAWYGGAMRDRENLAEGESAEGSATALFRRDGTGYLAGGNIHWDENGFIYADPTSFLVGVNGEGDAVQLALYFVKIEGEQTITGVKTFVDGIKIGNGLIEWDEEAQMYRFNGSMYATGDVVAYGVGKTEVQSVIDIIEEYLEEHGGGGGGGYEPPVDGIPKKDLASDVQASLEKADTALQTHQDISGKVNVSASNVTLDFTNTLLNKLSTGDSVPVDNDYFISQYVGGGDTYTTYHRRSVSKLAEYIRSTMRIWGQSFSENGQLSGDLISVSGAINLEYTNEINVYTGDLYLNHRGTISGYQGKNTRNIIALDNGGDFGLGINRPVGKLHILQSGWNNGLVLQRSVASSGCGIRVLNSLGNQLGIFGVNGNRNFEIGLNDANGSEQTRLNILGANGNVGIGTTSPSEKLHVEGGNARVSSSNNGAGGDVYVDLWRGANFSWRLLNSGGYLHLQTNGNQDGSTTNTGFRSVLVCSYKDNVGIGTATPEDKLVVEGRGVFNTWDYDSIVINRTNPSGGAWIRFNPANQSGEGYYCGSSADRSEFAIYYLFNGANSERKVLSVSNTGKVHTSDMLCVGANVARGNVNRAELTCVSSTNVPCDVILGSNNAKKWSLMCRDSGDNHMFALWSYVNSLYAMRIDHNGNLITNGDQGAYSDARLKSDIKDLEYRGSLSPKEYVKDGKKCIGFIAQEVRELYPELVLGEEKEDEYLSLNYGAITAVLSAENRELKKEVDELKGEVEELKKMVKLLMER